MIMFHVNLQGCIKGFLTFGFPSYPNQLSGFSAKLHPPFLQQILRFGTHLFRIRFLQKHLVFQRNETDTVNIRLTRGLFKTKPKNKLLMEEIRLTRGW